MKRLVLAPRALADIGDIARYIGKDDPRRARSFAAELHDKARQAADRPRSFRTRHDIAPGFRSIVHGRYLVLFRELEDEVRIERVVHTARNLRGIRID